jgi:hypothetical protein
MRSAVLSARRWVGRERAEQAMRHRAQLDALPAHMHLDVLARLL